MWCQRDRAEAGALNAETIPVIADASVVLRDVSAREAPVVVVVNTVGFRLHRLVDRVERGHFGHLGELLRICFEYTPRRQASLWRAQRVSPVRCHRPSRLRASLLGAVPVYGPLLVLAIFAWLLAAMTVAVEQSLELNRESAHFNRIGCLVTIFLDLSGSAYVPR